MLGTLYGERDFQTICFTIKNALRITINEQKKNGKKRKRIDVRILMKQNQIVICFKDNGAPLDLLKEWVDSGVVENISLAPALAGDIQYDYILGMNRSIVTIDLKGE